jgi:tetratricopeptide (TPR) repeat protein
MEFRLTSLAFIVVVATYLFLGEMGLTDRGNPEPREAAYNLLSRGLLSGHLHVDKEVPPGLARLANPYDPAANKAYRVDPRYRLEDFSYYQGRLYLYFGAAPALLLFIPWHLVTGAWLPHWLAVVILCSGGLLINLSLVRSVKARVFPGSEPWMTAVAALILGLGSYAPILLSRADMWEIPIAFNYLAVSLALRCLWGALGNPRPAAWLALASAALGAAFASRFTILPSAAILAVPFLDKGTRGSVRNWLAAALPIGLCVAGVLAYNAQRFGRPLDFGTSHMLLGDHPADLKVFGAQYFWTNMRLNLFQPVDWTSFFPFASEPSEAALKPNIGGAEHMSGALLNSPVLWAAFVIPVLLAARRQGGALGLLTLCVGWCVLCALGLLLFFCGANSRYQFEFASGLSVLAALGVMAADNALSGIARRMTRVAAALALVVSCAFPVLYGIDRCVSDHDYMGIGYLAEGNGSAAEREFDAARLLSPGNPFLRLESGVMLAAQGRRAEALGVLESLVRDFPRDPMAQLNLARVLIADGRRDEGLAHLRAAHDLAPDNGAISAVLEHESARPH